MGLVEQLGFACLQFCILVRVGLDESLCKYQPGAIIRTLTFNSPVHDHWSNDRFAASLKSRSQQKWLDKISGNQLL